MKTEELSAVFTTFVRLPYTRGPGRIFFFDSTGGPFIITFRNEVEGRIKCVLGPHLAPGPHFGHPCCNQWAGGAVARGPWLSGALGGTGPRGH